MIHQGVGVAKNQEANEILRVNGGAYGPISIAVENLDDSKAVVLSVVELSDLATHNTAKLLDTDTEVTAEASGYTGNTTLLDFTGQVANNLPLVPGTLVVKPTAGGDTVNANDLYGDGKLYTVDSDLDECGTVNYFTGAIELHFPAGKAPNTGAIAWDYQYSQSTAAKGVKTYKLSHMKPEESMVVKAAANGGASKVRIEVFVPAS